MSHAWVMTIWFICMAVLVFGTLIGGTFAAMQTYEGASRRSASSADPALNPGRDVPEVGVLAVEPALDPGQGIAAGEAPRAAATPPAA